MLFHIMWTIGVAREGRLAAQVTTRYQLTHVVCQLGRLDAILHRWLLRCRARP